MARILDYCAKHHQREIASLNLDGTRVVETKSPSEPAIADAALHCLTRTSHSFAEAFKAYAAWDDDVIGRDEMKDSLGRWVFLIATVKQCQTDAPAENLCKKDLCPFGRPRKLLGVLDEMIASEARDAVFQSCGCSQGLDVRERLSDIYLNAYFFSRRATELSFAGESIEDGVVITPQEAEANNISLLHMLPHAGSALLLQPSKHDFELLVPLYEGDPDATTDTRNIIPLLIQVNVSQGSGLAWKSLPPSRVRDYFSMWKAVVLRIELIESDALDDSPKAMAHIEATEDTPEVVYIQLCGLGPETFEFLSDPVIKEAWEELLKRSIPETVLDAPRAFDVNSWEERFGEKRVVVDEDVVETPR